MDRRRFLRLGLDTLASSSLLATLGGFERALAATSTDGYRALVCIYLYGGNDSFNMLVPRSRDAHAEYASARGNLAIQRDELLALRPQTSDGNDYGLHPSCSEMQRLFNGGNLSFVANVGALVEPVTRADYRTGRVRLPLQLFSHEDQEVQWMTSRSDSAERLGWAGRIGDLLAEQGYAPELSVNLSLGGTNVWQSAHETVPYALDASGQPRLDALGTDTGETYLKLLEQAGGDTSPFRQQFGVTQARALGIGQRINQALASAPPIQTQFPATHLGLRLRLAARMVAARNQLGAARQIFFVGLAGFDTHNRLVEDHGPLLRTLSQALGAFHDALIEIGAQDLVTTFTGSDFGRTLTSNGDGTDHAWGAHHIVMGGSVVGRSIFGRMPILALDGPDDVDTGRIIPAQSTDQYAATLSRWFGLGEPELDLVFPNLRNFGSRNLGFMS